MDLVDEGVTAGYRDGWEQKDFQEHRGQMASFISDSDKGTLIVQNSTGERIGTIVWRFRDLNTDRGELGRLFDEISSELPPDGMFCEIFQLWVDPRFRRQGIASKLKNALDSVTMEGGVRAIYTHTEEDNLHVLDLNKKLGYREVRLGPIWDSVVRMSLVKDLLLPDPEGRAGNLN